MVLLVRTLFYTNLFFVKYMQSLLIELAQAIKHRRPFDKSYGSTGLYTRSLDTDYDGYVWQANMRSPIRVLFEPALNDPQAGAIGLWQPSNRLDAIVNTAHVELSPDHLQLHTYLGSQKYLLNIYQGEDTHLNKTSLP